MLMDYINNNYDKAEPIFMYELPCTSQDALRQEMKKLTDEGKIIRIYNGVYYKPYKTILGTNGKMSINKFIEKKYLYESNESIGFISGIAMYNKYGFTTQIPSIIEVVTNAATTKQRKLEVDGYDIIVYKPTANITNENIIWIVYWIYAITSPTCIAPASIWYTPLHTIARHVNCISKARSGLNKAIVLPTNKSTL